MSAIAMQRLVNVEFLIVLAGVTAAFEPRLCSECDALHGRLAMPVGGSR